MSEYYMSENRNILYRLAMKLGRNAEKRMAKLVKDIRDPEMTEEQLKNINELGESLSCNKFKIQPMPYPDADSGAGNPSKDNWNCQSVIIAFEARRRGLDCFALPYDNAPDSVSARLGRDFSLAWINPKNGKNISPTKISGRNDGEILEKLNKELKIKGRYVLGINYQDDTGHVISIDVIVEKTKVFHDEQNNSYIEPKSIEKINYLELIRIDKAVFNVELVKSVLGMN